MIEEKKIKFIELEIILSDIYDKTLISCEIEKEKEIESILLHWNLIKSKVSGQSRYCLFKRK